MTLTVVFDRLRERAESDPALLETLQHLVESEPARVGNDQDLPFTERDPADRVLDNLRSGDPAYELMKQVMGIR
jgi:hypothetical protein